MIKIKRKHRKTETRIQQEIVKYLNLMGIKYYLASAGGIRAGIGTIMQLKRAGVINKGCPDLFIFEKRAGYCGLVLELKTGKAYKATEEQKEWLKHLSDVGFKTAVPVGLNEAINIIDEYLLQKNAVKPQIIPKLKNLHRLK